MDYKKNAEQVNGVVKKFTDKWDIETHEYIATTKQFSIVATKADIEKFGNQFAKNKIEWNIYSFKKTSDVGKDWVKNLEEQNLKVLSKPYFPFYLTGAVGKGSFRLFEMSDRVYASYSSKNGFEAPEGFIEMKASEFYKAIEDNESKGFS